jgi:AcrR family transcriptional regulator
MPTKRTTRKAQALDPKRRAPRQARAHDTVEVIFEAVARILQREGREALNTNHIADLAGISVGTLYQYFPNKKAILLAMARREIEATTNAVLDSLSGEASKEHDDPILLAIRALINQFTKRRKARHTALDTLVVEGHGGELETNLDAIAAGLAARSKQLLSGRSEKLSPIAAFVLTRAVNGVIVSASYESSPYLGTKEFESELVRLVRTFLDVP